MDFAWSRLWIVFPAHTSSSQKLGSWVHKVGVENLIHTPSCWVGKWFESFTFQQKALFQSFGAWDHFAPKPLVLIISSPTWVCPPAWSQLNKSRIIMVINRIIWPRTVHCSLYNTFTWFAFERPRKWGRRIFAHPICRWGNRDRKEDPGIARSHDIVGEMEDGKTHLFNQTIISLHVLALPFTPPFRIFPLLQGTCSVLHSPSTPIAFMDLNRIRFLPGFLNSANPCLSSIFRLGQCER